MIHHASWGRTLALLVSIPGILALSACDPDEAEDASGTETPAGASEDGVNGPFLGDPAPVSSPVSPLPGLDGVEAGQPEEVSQATKPIETELSSEVRMLLLRMHGYDHNGDTKAEINDLEPMSFEDLSKAPPKDAPLVVVFVEPRLLASLSAKAPTTHDLEEALLRWKQDMYAEGIPSLFLLADVHKGGHQNGLTLLGMRQFLIELRELYPNLRGTMLVGSFPEALIVRRWIQEHESGNDTYKLHGVSTVGRPILRIVPEVIADRSDLVLGDLTGSWPDLYHQDVRTLEGLLVAPEPRSLRVGWGTPGNWDTRHHLVSNAFQRKWLSIADFFFIQDDDYTEHRAENLSDVVLNEVNLSYFLRMRHPELAADDPRNLPNPIAMPDLNVSRINALHVAIEPDPDFVDVNGLTYLDAARRPQIVRRGERNVRWLRDAGLERRLLLDYFNRNHLHRMGENRQRPLRAAAIGTSGLGVAGLANYLDDALGAHTMDPDYVRPLVGSNEATLLDLAEWLKEPAILRGLYAHSTARSGHYSPIYGHSDLYESIGGRFWRWQRHGALLVPSVAEYPYAAGLHFKRSLWEYQTIKASGPSFYVDLGCFANSPYRKTYPYDRFGYASEQNAESTLFYLEGLAVVARAKKFNDRPEKFGATLSAHPDVVFGATWKASYEADSWNETLAHQVARVKKAYPWGMLGDWTLRLDY